MRNNLPYRLSAKQLFSLCGNAITRFKSLSEKTMESALNCGLKSAELIKGLTMPELALSFTSVEGLPDISSSVSVANMFDTPSKPLENIKRFFGKFLPK